MYDKSIAVIVSNRDTLNMFRTRTGNRHGITLPLLFNSMLEGLSNAIRQEKEKNGMRAVKEVKLFI